MKKNIVRLSVLILLFFIMTPQKAKAEVYSIVDQTLEVEGKDNCWLIVYSLWEDQNTLPMNDDTKIGTYSTTVGSGCTDHLIITPVILTSESAIELEIYPNPSSAHIRFLYHSNSSSDIIHWTIFDLTGRIIEQGNEQAEVFNPIKMKIDVSNFTSGSYLLHVHQGEDVLAKKFIVY